MRVQVTQKGVYDQKGQRVEVGSIVTVKADELPKNLINKVTVLAEEPRGRKAGMNPDRTEQAPADSEE